MTRAAEVFGVTQSAVSQSIHRLEGALGAELLDRHSRPLSLTAYGRNLIQLAAPIIQRIDALDAEIRINSGHYPIVTVGYSESVSATFGPWLTAYLTEKVDKVVVKTGMTAELVDKFLNDELDVLISPENLLDTDFIWRKKLYQEEFMIVLPKGERADNLEALAQKLPILIYNGQSSDREKIISFINSLPFKSFQRYSLESSYTMMGLVSAGEGWAVMPPCNIWEGREFVRKVEIVRMSAPKLMRSQYVICKEGFYSDLSQDLARQFPLIVEREIQPRFCQMSPQLFIDLA